MPAPRYLVTIVLSGAVLIVVTTGCVRQRLYRDTWIAASLQTKPTTQQTAVATVRVERATTGPEAAARVDITTTKELWTDDMW